MIKKLYRLLSFLPLLIPVTVSSQERPSTVVTTSYDVVDPFDGLISLREAIDYAGTDTCGTFITFNLPASDGNTLQLASCLRFVGISRTIDGRNHGPSGGTVRLIADSGQFILSLSGRANLTVQHLTFAQCSRPIQSGGAVLNIRATLIARHCQFDSNSSGFNGGAISNRGNAAGPSYFYAFDCLFRGNAAPSSTLHPNSGGAAVYCEKTHAELHGCTFQANQGDWGGALKVRTSSLLIDSCTFRGNRSPHRGGAIESQFSTLDLRGCIFDSNFVSSPLTLPSDTLAGGAIYSLSDHITLTGCSFTHNSAQDHGGAIYYQGTLDTSALAVTRTQFTHNQAASGHGGALALAHCHGGSWAVVASNSFHSNSANLGGALHCICDPDSAAATLVANCAFEANQALSASGGGALYCASPLQLCNSLFLDNLAGGLPNDLHPSAATFSRQNVWSTLPDTSFVSTSDTILSSLPPQFLLDVSDHPITQTVVIRGVPYLVHPIFIDSYLATAGVSVSVDTTHKALSYYDGSIWRQLNTNQPSTPSLIDSIDQIGHPRGPTHLPKSIGTIQRTTYQIDTIATCLPDTLHWHNMPTLTSGTYYDTTHHTLFDTISHLHLTVLQSSHHNIDTVALQNFTWHDTTYTASGLYLFSYLSPDNCPSTDTLRLTIIHSSHNVYEITACESYLWYGSIYTTSGTYTYSYTNEQGAPSTDTLHLTIHYGSHNTIADTACETYTWHGTEYQTTGDYTYGYTNSDNCPSTDTLHLTIHNGTYNAITDTA